MQEVVRRIKMLRMNKEKSKPMNENDQHKEDDVRPRRIDTRYMTVINFKKP